MALFVVRHQHPADRCPAADPQMGAQLLDYLGTTNAERNGITIHSEAVIDNQHTLYIILEANDTAIIDRFMQPFKMAGSVEILQASPCTAVVARRGCAA
ncbi:MAG: sulfite oxidase [Chloroflexi bacterium]|nr:sulfite oxidase [Chloroflexota bacterium]